MNALGRYAIAGFLVVLVATLALWPFVGAEGHRSLLISAAVALPVQIGAFALLSRALGDPRKFMMWWGAGVLGRVLVVIGLGLAITRLDGIDPSVLLMSAAGYFFALLLLEPAFFDRTANLAQYAQ